MAIFSQISVILGFLALIQTSYQVDICEILDANYCFYFSDASCYINLCKCEACSPSVNFTDDRVRNLLEGSDDSTTFSNSSVVEKLCPSWCPHIRSNETIVNILAINNSTTSSIGEKEDISFECDDLEKNCLASNGYNGHCYFYEKNCDYKPQIAMRGKSKPGQKQLKKCLKFQKKCHEKYPRHYSCKMLRKKCRGVKLPNLTTNSTSSTNSTSTPKFTTPLEQCINYQKICAQKYSKHFTCRQFNKKCKEYSLPPIEKVSGVSENEAEAEIKEEGHEEKKKDSGRMSKKHHGNKNENETIIVENDLIIGNQTLID